LVNLIDIKTVVILGSTGSIGMNAVKFLVSNSDKFRVRAILAFSNINILQNQIDLLKPEFVGLIDGSAAHKLNLPEGIKLITGPDAGREIASIESDINICAVVGIAALELALLALRYSKRLALANKESVVCGWFLLKELADQYNREIIPIDSEHSGLYQLLNNNINKPIKLTLTCSGGPFLYKPADEFSSITCEQALAHPRWKMGGKISIDSATLVNKALEKIEAHHLFGFAPADIDIVIHPESIVHAMIGFEDGAVLMQASYTDMIMPIAYSLTYPQRFYTGMKLLDFPEIANLSFMKVDRDKFKVIDWLDDMFSNIRFYGVVFNSANEELVRLFLQNKISFIQIYDVIDFCLQHIEVRSVDSLIDIIELDKEVRSLVLRRV
jgi:1-deoxy-D-xylulose-5-phosphate reductoisomerase